MTLQPTKDQLLDMFVKKTLFNFLMKKGLIKKGDTVSYGKLLGITTSDLHNYFDTHGFPGINIPRHEIRRTPQGGEADVEWTLNEGLYEVWFTERNVPTPIFSSRSKAEFEEYWKKETIGGWEYQLNHEWIF